MQRLLVEQLCPNPIIPLLLLAFSFNLGLVYHLFVPSFAVIVNTRGTVVVAFCVVKALDSCCTDRCLTLKYFVSLFAHLTTTIWPYLPDRQ